MAEVTEEPAATAKADTETTDAPESESEESQSRHRRRRMRKSHRPRFPTLAETGGLPPRRDTNQPSDTP